MKPMASQVAQGQSRVDLPDHERPLLAVTPPRRGGAASRSFARIALVNSTDGEMNSESSGRRFLGHTNCSRHGGVHEVIRSSDQW